MAPEKPGKKKAKPPVREIAASTPHPPKYTVAVVCAALILACIAIYAQTLSHDFVNYDDNRFLVKNAQMQSGLTWATVAWAFTIQVENYLMPLSWLSHALDCQLYGMWAGGHHLTSLIIHALNAVLLFWVLLRLTRAPWQSAMVAALFAVHPLHVESVAWASERKDVLSTLFWCLTLLAYTHYAAKPMARRYLLVAAMYVLALLSKPMVVTLPFLLLLLDYWPLGRIRFEPFNRAARATAVRLIAEKAPLLLLAAADGAATFLLQETEHAKSFFGDTPLTLRLWNAVVSYGFFLVKAVFPSGLTVAYQWPAGAFPLWQTAGSAVLLLAVTAGALALAKKRPYLIVGWLWYLGLMVPTVQVMQRHAFAYARADRYTYCALIGIAVMVVWGAADLAAARRVPKRAVAAASGIVLVVLTVCAHVQASCWRDSETLFRHAIAVGQESVMAFNTLGKIALDAKRYDEARDYLTKALDLNAEYTDAVYNLGVLAMDQGQYDEARTHLDRVLELKAEYFDSPYESSKLAILNNYGKLALLQKRYAEARTYLTRALELDPQYEMALNNLGALEVMEGRYDEAKTCLNKVLALHPDDVDVLNNMGGCCMYQGQYEEAQVYLQKVVKIDPKHRDALKNLGALLARLGRQEEADVYLKRAAELGPSGSAGKK